MTSSQPRDQQWQIDRKVPLALIGVLLLQTFGAVFWAAGLQAKADNNERGITKLEASVKEQSEFRVLVMERLAKIDARMDAQTTLLTDIKSDMRKK